MEEQDVSAMESPLAAAMATAIEKRLRLYLASQTLPVGRQAAPALQEWLEAMPTVGDFANDQDAQIQAALTADLQRLTCRTFGETAGFFPKMQQFLADCATSDLACSLLIQAGEQLQPEALGMWIELMPDNLDMGCFFPVPLSLQRMLTHVQPSRARENLQTWAEQIHCDDCSEFGLSLGSGNEFLTFQIPLPGSNGVEQLNNGLSAFAHLKQPALPQDVIELLRTNAKPGLLLSVWLGDGGVVKVGLRLPQPEVELMLQLCSTTGNNSDLELAKFEGSLGVRQPAYIEGQQLATGFGVELHYEVV